MHDCFATGCNKQVEDEMLMCLRHWRMVPADIQREVWRTYRDPERDGHTAAILKARKAVEEKGIGPLFK